MPRHIVTPPEKAATGRHRNLVDILARELKADGETPQPLVIERYRPVTKSRSVAVIWDKWKGVPDEVRPEVVVAAYEKAEGKEYADSIDIADAVTPAEALALGLLPYAVVPVRRKDAANTLVDYAGVVLEEGRNTVFGPEPGAGLRYAREEDAAAAVARLTATLPGSVWAIKQHVEGDEP